MSIKMAKLKRMRLINTKELRLRTCVISVIWSVLSTVADVVNFYEVFKLVICEIMCDSELYNIA